MMFDPSRRLHGWRGLTIGFYPPNFLAKVSIDTYEYDSSSRVEVQSSFSLLLLSSVRRLCDEWWWRLLPRSRKEASAQGVLRAILQRGGVFRPNQQLPSDILSNERGWMEFFFPRTPPWFSTKKRYSFRYLVFSSCPHNVKDTLHSKRI